VVEATLTADGLERVRKVPLVHQMPAAVFAIAGPGALQCLQGLVTNDLAKPADGSLIYGAMLTPKGLIILDCWIVKQAERFIFITDLDARATAQDLFRKLLPPRLARVTDLSEEWQVYRALNAAPEPMTAQTVVARAAAGSPFSALILGPVDDVAHTLKAMAVHGARTATDDEWQAARILAGWPQRGAEIDEKTLVQEVRFDENGGVSYEKGCYTGQETVARLHFRGHTNRDLRGLVLNGTELPADGRVMLGEKEVGSVRSILSLPTARLALALVRREVETGQVVTVGGVAATVAALPFQPL
jgi:folate-binding protein YgfZ